MPGTDRRLRLPGEVSMPGHDALFKSLLRGFFDGFLRLIVPALARRLDLTALAPLDKELFTDWPQRRRREVDLLVRVPHLGGRGDLLVHVEIEARARREMARRLWHYGNQIQALHGLEVLPVVVYLRGGRPGVHLERWEDRLLEPEQSDFRFYAFGLSGCRAEEWLAKPEPLAWGLAALMRSAPWDRAEHKLACLRRIAAALLPELSRFLLVNCVETYLELNAEESARFASLGAREEDEQVRATQRTWADRMREEGKETGLTALRQVLLRLLGQRFGAVPDGVRQGVERIASLERLAALAERVLEVRSLEELDLG
jgi:putative YhgA-like transposase